MSATATEAPTLAVSDLSVSIGGSRILPPLEIDKRLKGRDRARHHAERAITDLENFLTS